MGKGGWEGGGGGGKEEGERGKHKTAKREESTNPGSAIKSAPPKGQGLERGQK